MQTFLGWVIPIMAFILLELVSRWFDHRLRHIIQQKHLRFVLMRLITVTILTIMISLVLHFFLHVQGINPGGIFIALCIVYVLLWTGSLFYS